MDQLLPKEEPALMLGVYRKEQIHMMDNPELETEKEGLLAEQKVAVSKPWIPVDVVLRFDDSKIYKVA